MTTQTQTFGTLSEAEADEFTSLLVFGLDTPETIDGVSYKAFEPVRLNDAAKFLGFRTRRAHRAFNTPKVRGMWREKMEQLRDGERPRNLHVAMQIRDTEGDGLAADRTVQLKAIATLEGQTGKGVNVSVNVSQQTNVATITPGYVIKLRPTQVALDGMPALPMNGETTILQRQSDMVEPVILEHEQ